MYFGYLCEVFLNAFGNVQDVCVCEVKVGGNV